MNFSAPVLCPIWICNLCKNTNCFNKCLKCEVRKEIGEKEWIFKNSQVLPEVLPQVLPEVSPRVSEVLPEVITRSVVHIEKAVSSAPVSPLIIEVASPPVDIVSLASPPVSSPQISQSDVSRALSSVGVVEQPVVNNTYSCHLCLNKKPYTSKGFLENHKFTVHGDITVPGIFEIPIRYIRDNKTEKRHFKLSHKVKDLFEYIEKGHQISTLVLNNKTLSPSETFKDLKMKPGDEILVYEVEYASGEREPSEPAPKRRKSTSSSSSSSSSNQVSGASVVAIEVSENNTI